MTYKSNWRLKLRIKSISWQILKKYNYGFVIQSTYRLRQKDSYESSKSKARSRVYSALPKNKWDTKSDDGQEKSKGGRKKDWNLILDLTSNQFQLWKTSVRREVSSFSARRQDAMQWIVDIDDFLNITTWYRFRSFWKRIWTLYARSWRSDCINLIRSRDLQESYEMNKQKLLVSTMSTVWQDE